MYERAMDGAYPTHCACGPGHHRICLAQCAGNKQAQGRTQANVSLVAAQVRTKTKSLTRGYTRLAVGGSTIAGCALEAVAQMCQGGARMAGEAPKGSIYRAPLPFPLAA
jgi:hypothetical protein